jgi:hypothetical protein
MINKIIGFLVMVLLICTSTFAVLGTMNYVSNEIVLSTVSNFEWSMTYGGSQYERIYCVHETDDGGYIGCGQTEVGEGLNTAYRPWVLKVDSQGIMEWEWNLTEVNDYTDAEYYFSYFFDTYCSFIQQTSDGGYLLCFGFKDHIPIGGDEYYPYHLGGIIKLDGFGSEVWRRFFYDDLEWVFLPFSFLETSDGGFILTGNARNPDPASTDCEAGLMKVDSNGIEQWY